MWVWVVIAVVVVVVVLAVLAGALRMRRSRSVLRPLSLLEVDDAGEDASTTQRQPEDVRAHGNVERLR